MSDAALEIARLRAALAASEARVETAGARAQTAESELAQARAVVGASEAMINISNSRSPSCDGSSMATARSAARS